ncbi:hypothetical protein SDC9_179516 [bioreactor metagenome]|uniref:Uncharacterized protein n=1 Tax=bioreactor metagenome TaxID=1076179 RepID=A0A645H040_9ZZZZ
MLTLGEGTSEWSDWIEIAVNWYGMVWNFLKSILGSVWKIVSGVVQWISKSEIIKDAFKVIHWFLGGIFDIVGWVGERLVYVWEEVLKPMLDTLESVYIATKEFLGLSSDEPLKVEATKIIKDEKTTTPSYVADLTRFKKGSAISDGEDEKKKNKEKSKKTGDTISGGGPRVVNITLGKFFDNIQFTTLNTNETTDKLESIILECLGRVLYNGAKVT